MKSKKNLLQESKNEIKRTQKKKPHAACVPNLKDRL